MGLAVGARLGGPLRRALLRSYGLGVAGCGSGWREDEVKGLSGRVSWGCEADAVVSVSLAPMGWG